MIHIQFLILSLVLSFIFQVINRQHADASEKIVLAKNQYLLGSCTIFDADFKLVMQLPGGNVCLPLSDGTLVASDHLKLRKYDQKGKEIWSLDGEYHHQLAFTQNKILALKAEVKDFLNQKIRYDVVEQIDLQGKILNRFSYKENLETLTKNQVNGFTLASFPDRNAVNNNLFEVSHFNSVKVNAQGIVINDLNSGQCYLLDENLKFKKVIFTFRNDSPTITEKSNGRKTQIANTYAVHDCYFSNSQGQAFINNYNIASNSRGYRIVKFNSKKILKVLPSADYPTSTTEHGGGVLKLKDQWLVSAVISDVTAAVKTTEVLLLSDHTGKVLKKWSLPFYIQDLQLVDLNGFIKNSDYL